MLLIGLEYCEAVRRNNMEEHIESKSQTKDSGSWTCLCLLSETKHEEKKICQLH